MYRAAIIGTGRIASRLEKDPLRPKPHTHAGWYRHHPEVELVAGADIDADALAEFGADWNLPAAALFSDYRGMLREVRPDLVSICAWAPDRLAMTEAAVAAGARGLWLEKAIACSIGQAERLARIVESAGVKAIVDHPRRTQPPYRAVARIVEQQTLGPLETVHCLMSGCLIHTGSHAWDLLDWWCGSWAGAEGWIEGDVSTAGTIADAGGCGHIAFENGVHAFVTGCEKDYYIFQFDLVFRGGRIQIGNDVCRVYQPADSPRYTGFIELAEAAGFVLDDPCPYPAVFDLVHALETNEEPVMSIGNAIAAFRMGLALFQSHRAGHSLVTPFDLDPDLCIESR